MDPANDGIPTPINDTNVENEQTVAQARNDAQAASHEQGVDTVEGASDRDQAAWLDSRFPSSLSHWSSSSSEYSNVDESERVLTLDDADNSQIMDIDLENDYNTTFADFDGDFTEDDNPGVDSPIVERNHLSLQAELEQVEDDSPEHTALPSSQQDEEQKHRWSPRTLKRLEIEEGKGYPYADRPRSLAGWVTFDGENDYLEYNHSPKSTHAYRSSQSRPSFQRSQSPLRRHSMPELVANTDDNFDLSQTSKGVLLDWTSLVERSITNKASSWTDDDDDELFNAEIGLTARPVSPVPTFGRGDDQNDDGAFCEPEAQEHITGRHGSISSIISEESIPNIGTSESVNEDIPPTSATADDYFQQELAALTETLPTLSLSRGSGPRMDLLAAKNETIPFESDEKAVSHDFCRDDLDFSTTVTGLARSKVSAFPVMEQEDDTTGVQGPFLSVTGDEEAHAGDETPVSPTNRDELETLTGMDPAEAAATVQDWETRKFANSTSAEKSEAMQIRKVELQVELDMQDDRRVEQGKTPKNQKIPRVNPDEVARRTRALAWDYRFQRDQAFETCMYWENAQRHSEVQCKQQRSRADALQRELDDALDQLKDKKEILDGMSEQFGKKEDKTKALQANVDALAARVEEQKKAVRNARAATEAERINADQYQQQAGIWRRELEKIQRNPTHDACSQTDVETPATKPTYAEKGVQSELLLSKDCRSSDSQTILTQYNILSPGELEDTRLVAASLQSELDRKDKDVVQEQEENLKLRQMLAATLGRLDEVSSNGGSVVSNPSASPKRRRASPPAPLDLQTSQTVSVLPHIETPQNEHQDALDELPKPRSPLPTTPFPAPHNATPCALPSPFTATVMGSTSRRFAMPEIPETPAPVLTDEQKRRRAAWREMPAYEEGLKCLEKEGEEEEAFEAEMKRSRLEAFMSVLGCPPKVLGVQQVYNLYLRLGSVKTHVWDSLLV